MIKQNQESALWHELFLQTLLTPQPGFEKS